MPSETMKRFSDIVKEVGNIIRQKTDSPAEAFCVLGMLELVLTRAAIENIKRREEEGNASEQKGS